MYLFLPRNLVSSSLFNKANLKLIFELDKVIIIGNSEFVGKSYSSDGLFILNTIPKNCRFVYLTYGIVDLGI